MKLTKEEAREILNTYIMIHGTPIYDSVVHVVKVDGKEEGYTFRGLLMFVYDLKD